MRACAAMLLCAVVVAVAVAFPPAPQAKPSVPWVTGWDKPVDPVGDCRFERKGDKLTIVAPVRDERGPIPTASLLRDADGDFDAQVRVSGRLTTGQYAGILLTDGEGTIHLLRCAWPAKSGLQHCINLKLSPGKFITQVADRGEWGSPTYLGLTRRGTRVTVSLSAYGKDWLQVKAQELDLPRKLKVGVSVATTAEAMASFTAVFDQFQLTPLGGKTR